MSIKKDATQKTKKKEEELKKKKKESEFTNEKLFEEIKAVKDKLQKLAAQFDKELTERDKQIKKIEHISQGDVTKAFGSLQVEAELLRKQINDLDLRKAEKRELTEMRAKVLQSVEQKAELGDVHSAISGITGELTQKSLELRQELFKKVGDIQSKCFIQ